MNTSPLRILYIAYPLLPVSDASAGGAEQMLWTLEREMHHRGHRTTVAACAGSSVSGTLFVTGDAPRQADSFEDRNREHREAIVHRMERETFDLIHDKSGSFFGSADEPSIPLLATLHLPRSFYPDINWNALAVNLKLNCVSAAQAHTFAELPNLAGWVANGIALERFPFHASKSDYLLWLGRICEEKAPHIAIEAARRTGRRLVLAGQVYPFRYHQEYFVREVKPHLGGPIQFIDSPSFEHKVELLAHASALLVPSQVDETSSLVAMEAMACGTPVLAFRRGALPEVVADGKTGYVVDTFNDLVAAVVRLADIDPQGCRNHVEQHFSAIRMTDDYAMLYQQMLGQSRGEAA